MDRWVGKVAVVTGASSGIGEAICKSLVGAGLKVLGLARREDRLKELAKSLKKTSKGSFYFLRCDLRNEKEILTAFKYAVEKLGSVDVLVNNAGFATFEPIAEGKTDSFRRVLEVNVLAATICCREAVQFMRKHKNEGHIFNINSIAGLNAACTKVPFNLYAASKHALFALTESLKIEINLNKDNIRMTSIHPGIVNTEFGDASGVGSQPFSTWPYLSSEHIADCLKFALCQPPVVQLETITVTPLHQAVY